VKLAVAEIRHWDAVRRVGYIRRLAGGRDVRFTAAIIENGSEVDVARGQRSLVAVEGGFEAGRASSYWCWRRSPMGHGTHFPTSGSEFGASAFGSR